MDALFQVGWHKGEIDFRVRGDIASLTQEEMNQFRAMLVVAIGTMEDMWRREQERKYAAQCWAAGAAPAQTHGGTIPEQ